MAIDISKAVELTPVHIKRIFGVSDQVAVDWHAAIKPATDERNINTIARLSAFLANIKVESGSLSTLTENLNYSSSRLLQVFPKYFPTKALADQYANQPEKIANRVYANRLGNGSEDSGDGWNYRGRGLIQLTGKANYTAATQGGVSCLGSNSSYLTTKEGAARSAAWFWTSKALNGPADQAQFETVCRRINGGLNGYSERQTAYQLAIVVLSALPDGTVINLEPTDPGLGTQNQIEVVHKDPGTINSIDALHQTIQEPIVAGKAQYPWNQVFESRSGHLIEIDDTPSQERLHWYHRTGTYTEMQPDGNFVTKSIKDYYIFVNSDSFRDVKGDETINIVGQSYEKVGQKVIESDDGATIKTTVIQLDAPEVNAQETCNLPIINAQFIKVRAGDKYSGPVCDMKVRDSDHADFAEGAKWSMRAGSLGPGKATPKDGSRLSGNWSSLHDQLWTGTVSFDPVSLSESFIGFKDSNYSNTYLEAINNNFKTILGNDTEIVNGDRLIESGGDVVDHNIGEREIASGEKLTIISDTAIEIKAPAVKFSPVKSMLFIPITGISQLDPPSAVNNGLIAVYVDSAGVLHTAKSNGTTWTVLV